MLEMRPNCECCDRDLEPWADDVVICSFECTWCTRCASLLTGQRCPNCGGELTARPPRSREKVATAPQSTLRVFNPDCMRNYAVVRPG